jgi:hypothetical protein
MIIIKATLRDETRRLMFDSNGFPEYDDVQQRVSSPSPEHWLSGKRTGGRAGRTGGKPRLPYHSILVVLHTS